jgi:hypothetical protein
MRLVIMICLTTPNMVFPFQIMIPPLDELSSRALENRNFILWTSYKQGHICAGNCAIWPFFRITRSWPIFEKKQCKLPTDNIRHPKNLSRDVYKCFYRPTVLSRVLYDFIWRLRSAIKNSYEKLKVFCDFRQYSSDEDGASQ